MNDYNGICKISILPDLWSTARNNFERGLSFREFPLYLVILLMSFGFNNNKGSVSWAARTRNP